jgi:hypothetical protein
MTRFGKISPSKARHHRLASCYKLMGVIHCTLEEAQPDMNVNLEPDIFSPGHYVFMVNRLSTHSTYSHVEFGIETARNQNDHLHKWITGPHDTAELAWKHFHDFRQRNELPS